MHIGDTCDVRQGADQYIASLCLCLSSIIDKQINKTPDVCKEHTTLQVCVAITYSTTGDLCQKSTIDMFTHKVKRYCIAVNGSTPWHSYGVSLAIWDHTVLPATRHK